jgi:hypothetical protein
MRLSSNLQRLELLLAAAAVTLSMSAGVAAASSGGGNPPPTFGGSHGKGTTTVKYMVSYVDALGNPVRCTGVHQTGKNFPGTTTLGGQDSFTCMSTTGSPLVGVTPGQVFTLATGVWNSDYFLSAFGEYIYNTAPFTLTVSADRMSYTGVAPFYPLG